MLTENVEADIRDFQDYGREVKTLERNSMDVLDTLKQNPDMLVSETFSDFLNCISLPVEVFSVPNLGVE